jgi:hypothetical protein
MALACRALGGLGIRDVSSGALPVGRYAFAGNRIVWDS